ncbi:hypothetical protein PIB30_014741 [Stylosanthes scabra]|uniref:Uncharacterized protein n=1 Tax=Stylosanthes scabra TaxID=79078 RepID=A0ABU6X6H6_9FABA|nr:hypothetical protein [Stylosanthes scabra]
MSRLTVGGSDLGHGMYGSTGSSSSSIADTKNYNFLYNESMEGLLMRVGEMQGIRSPVYRPVVGCTEDGKRLFGFEVWLACIEKCLNLTVEADLRANEAKAREDVSFNTLRSLSEANLKKKSSQECSNLGLSQESPLIPLIQGPNENWEGVMSLPCFPPGDAGSIAYQQLIQVLDDIRNILLFTNVLKFSMASRTLVPRKLDPPETFNAVANDELRFTEFDVVTRVGEVRGQGGLISALAKRWRPESHTFHFPVGESTVTHAYVPDPPPTHMYEQSYHAYVPHQEAYVPDVHSQPAFSPFDKNSIRDLRMILSSDEGATRKLYSPNRKQNRNPNQS